MIDRFVWTDQAEFNRQLRPPPQTLEERTALTKEIMLHLVSECCEMLDASGTWKTHHRTAALENIAQVRSELIDMFKYWLTLVQAWDVSVEDLEDAYWLKSAAVRQRYAEEWINSIDRPCVVLDLDNVLCDYTSGFLGWVQFHFPGTVDPVKLMEVKQARSWIDGHTLGVNAETWRTIKHAFYTRGAFRHMPEMPGVADFIAWCRANAWAVIIVTSRPIHQYPSIYADTIWWLNHHDIPHDFVWWGVEKGKKLTYENMTRPFMRHIQFVVDDDPRFVRQYARMELLTYWVRTTSLGEVDPLMNVVGVQSLNEIRQEHTCRTQIPDTGLTPPILVKPLETTLTSPPTPSV